ESEPRSNVSTCEILDRITGRAINQKRDHGAKHDLISNASKLGVVVKYDPRRARRRRKLTRHFPLVGLATRRRPLDSRIAGVLPAATSLRFHQRIGGAY